MEEADRSLSAGERAVDSVNRPTNAMALPHCIFNPCGAMIYIDGIP